MSREEAKKKVQRHKFYKMLPDQYLEARADDEGRPCFRYYDKEKEETIYEAATVKGILIGTAMRLSVFDPNYGGNGGSYKSNFYAGNNFLVLFSPRGEVAVKGDMEEIEAYIAKEIGATPRKKQILFVLNSTGLTAVETNLSIAIDQLRGQDDEIWIDRAINLIPTMYSPDDPNISKKAHGYLGKLAAKNKPCYANIVHGEPLTDKIWEDVGADKHLDNYLKWREQETSRKPMPDQANTPPDEAYTEEAEIVKQAPEDEEERDDLPF